MADKREADFLAELSALETKRGTLPVAAPPAKKKKEPEAPSSEDSLVKKDFLSDIQAFKAKPRKAGETGAKPQPAPVQPPVAKKPAPSPVIEPAKPKPIDVSVKPPQDMASLDLDIPLIEDSIDSYLPSSAGTDRKRRSPRPSGDIMTEISVVRRQLEGSLARLKALEGTTGPVKIGAMGGLESEPPPYARIKPAIETDQSPNDPYQPSSARDMRTIRRDVDSILENAGRMSIDEEINSFTELIRSVTCLSPLFPRISEIIDRGEMSQNVLLTLYRNASRYLQGEIAQKEQELDSTQKEFKKYRESMKKLNNVLGGRGKEMPGISTGADSGPSGDGGGEGEMFVLREQSKKKDQVIDQLEKRVQSVKDDFERYRQRQKKELDRLVAKDREDVILDMLTVVDNFERAMGSLTQSRNVEAMIQGFTMIHDEFVTTLSKYGLQEVEADKVKFNPHMHEAMMREETDEYPDGTVIEVLRKGYHLGDRLLRPAQVKTSAHS